MLVNGNFIWATHIYSLLFFFFFFFPVISVMTYANLVSGTEPNPVQSNPIQHRPPSLHIQKYRHQKMIKL